MKIAIRKATRRDLNEISSLFLQESTKKPYNQKWNRKTAMDKIKEFFECCDIWLVEDTGSIVGFITLRISLWDKGKEATINEFWLKPSYQGRGLGKKLLLFAEKESKKRGTKTFFLVSNKKSKAFGFYKKMGYNECKDLVLMEKSS